MGSGSWSNSSYVNYSTNTRGFASMDDFKYASTQSLYKSNHMNESLNPYNVIRECCDSEEHPNTVPVILALDVTGSMGMAASRVATRLGDIMEHLYKEVEDVQFMTMAIGDFAYDTAPLQVTQFESDIRIADQQAKIWFEGHGGGNSWESYTASWYFGVNNCSLDCWKRGKKGIIITMGDEALNPYIPADAIRKHIGNSIQADVDTEQLYKEAIKKFDIYHLGVNDSATCFNGYKRDIEDSFGKLLKQNYIEVNLDNLDSVISNIIIDSVTSKKMYTDPETPVIQRNEDGISW